MTRLFGLTSVVLFLVCAAPAAAQKNTLGINFRVSGATDVGFTWYLSPKVAIRPSLSGSSSTIVSPLGGGDTKVTQVAITTDFLVNASTAERITTYLGFGATISSVNSDDLTDRTRWGVRTLFGARVHVIDRVALFGEASLTYSHSDDGETFVGLST